MRLRSVNFIWSALFATSLLISVLSIPQVIAQSAATKGAPTAVDRTQMRKDFAAARKALSENRIDAYKKLLPKLRDYPLLPYLEYEELGRRLHTLPKAEVTTFLEKNANS